MNGNTTVTSAPCDYAQGDALRSAQNDETGFASFCKRLDREDIRPDKSSVANLDILFVRDRRHCHWRLRARMMYSRGET
jgi:hypothetical protein